ncbi:MAG: PEP-CTERM sorting domain-containing protein [Phycisphaeraceae bacterium]
MMRTSLLLAGMGSLATAAPASAFDASDLGFYDGDWFNTTFSSTGNMDFTFTSDGSSVTVSIQLGGFVFGFPAPAAPLVYSFPINGGTGEIDFATVGDPLLGDITGSADSSGNVSLFATNFAVTSPAFGFDSFSISGTASDGVIDFDYTIEASGTVFAVGEINAVQIPEPASVALLSLGMLALTRRSA